MSRHRHHNYVVFALPWQAWLTLGIFALPALAGLAIIYAIIFIPVVIAAVIMWLIQRKEIKRRYAEIDARFKDQMATQDRFYADKLRYAAYERAKQKAHYDWVVHCIPIDRRALEELKNGDDV